MTTPPIVSITDELVAELGSFVSTPTMFAGTVRPIQDAMRALLAERAELKRDAERYRWYKKNARYRFYADEVIDLAQDGRKLDAAIDAAMQP